MDGVEVTLRGQPRMEMRHMAFGDARYALPLRNTQGREFAPEHVAVIWEWRIDEWWLGRVTVSGPWLEGDGGSGYLAYDGGDGAPDWARAWAIGQRPKAYPVDRDQHGIKEGDWTVARNVPDGRTHRFGTWSDAALAALTFLDSGVPEVVVGLGDDEYVFRKLFK